MTHDAEAILPIDMENADGRDRRSTCLEAARQACPHGRGVRRSLGTMRHASVANNHRRMIGQHDGQRRLTRLESHASHVCAWV